MGQRGQSTLEWVIEAGRDFGDDCNTTGVGRQKAIRVQAARA